MTLINYPKRLELVPGVVQDVENINDNMEHAQSVINGNLKDDNLSQFAGLSLFKLSQDAASIVFPDCQVIDNFNRANSTDSLGPNWGENIFQNFGSFDLVSNQAQPGAAFKSNYWLNFQAKDVDVILDVVTAPIAGVSIVARLNSPNNDPAVDFYDLQCDGTTSFLRKIINGAVTALLNLNVNYTAGQKMGLRVRGSLIQAWRHDGTSWALVGQVTDTDIATTGFCGMLASSGETAFVCDNFGAEPISDSQLLVWDNVNLRWRPSRFAPTKLHKDNAVHESVLKFDTGLDPDSWTVVKRPPAVDAVRGLSDSNAGGFYILQCKLADQYDTRQVSSGDPPVITDHGIHDPTINNGEQFVCKFAGRYLICATYEGDHGATQDGITLTVRITKNGAMIGRKTFIGPLGSGIPRNAGSQQVWAYDTLAVNDIIRSDFDLGPAIGGFGVTGGSLSMWRVSGL